jgi:hypothetical protein
MPDFTSGITCFYHGTQPVGFQQTLLAAEAAGSEKATSVIKQKLKADC